MESQIKVLRWFRRSGVVELQPTPDPSAALGHKYVALEDGELKGEKLRSLLDGLVALGCLSRRPFDRIHTCPACGRWELNFREVCPSCRAVDHQLEEVLHHFPCAFAGPRTRFARDGKLVCPKCERELLQIGIDYDRPGRVRICACAETFDDPMVECRCLACSALFPVEQAEPVVLHAYRLTQRGRLAAETGQLDPVDFTKLAQDSELGVYTFSYLCHRIDEEAARARRFARPMSVVLLQLGAPMPGAGGGPDAGVLAQALARCVRPGELLGRFDEHTLVYLLPEASADEARGAVGRLGSELAGMLRLPGAPAIPFGVAAFPEQPDREALLSAAARDLAEQQSPARLACVS